MRDLQPLIAPRSIAIVGASSRAGTVASLPLANLQRLQYPGAIYPVNPSRTEIGGLPCYPSVEALPAVPDLALIVAPTAGVLPALEGCARHGVRAAIVISAGFAEAGPGGSGRAGPHARPGPGERHGAVRPQQHRRAELRRQVPAVVLAVGRHGPVARRAHRLRVAERRPDDDPRQPRLRRGHGASYSLATGNEADLTVADALAYLAEDEHPTRSWRWSRRSATPTAFGPPATACSCWASRW